MQCYYYLDHYPWGTRLGVRNEEPVCGEDFCDHCGDCLVCQCQDDLCYDGTPHSWVKYVSQDEWDALTRNE